MSRRSPAALRTPSLHKALLTVLMLLASLAWRDPALAQGAVDPDWAATWQASPQEPRPNSLSVAGQTVRQVARVSIGGPFVRVRLSNEFGERPLTIDAAHIALAGQGAAIQPGTDRPLTFATRRTVTIPPGARILSDPVNLAVPPLSDVAVSLYFPQRTGPVTEHVFAMQTGYVAPGNVTGAANLPGATTITHRVVLTGVEVPYQRRARGKVVVAFGDTATDGFGSTAGANRRWPDLLAARLNGRRGQPPTAVVNAGIAGNRMMHDFIGPNGLARFDRDVLSQANVTHVIIMMGINDFGLPGGRKIPEEEVTVQDVANGLQELIARARVQGIKVIGATRPPFQPIPDRPGFWSEAAEKKRSQLNQYIRSSGAFDGVIDFEAALKDPANPNRLNPAYDSGDHFTPNDAGYAAMAEAVDPKLFN